MTSDLSNDSAHTDFEEDDSLGETVAGAEYLELWFEWDKHHDFRQNTYLHQQNGKRFQIQSAEGRCKDSSESFFEVFQYRFNKIRVGSQYGLKKATVRVFVYELVSGDQFRLKFQGPNTPLKQFSVVMRRPSDDQAYVVYQKEYPPQDHGFALTWPWADGEDEQE